MAEPFTLVNNRLAIETDDNTYDLSGNYVSALPVPANNIISPRQYAGRSHLFRSVLNRDLTYTINGVMDDNQGYARAIQSAIYDSEKIKVLDWQTDAKRWTLVELVAPTASVGGEDIFEFTWTLAQTGDLSREGDLLATQTTAQSATGVPTGAYAMIYVRSVGTLTSLVFRYNSTTNYEYTITPTVGFHSGQFTTGGGATIPATRSSGNFTLIPTPTNAVLDLVIGYGTNL